MVRIIGVGPAVPPYMVTQQQARDYAAQHFRRYLAHVDRLAAVFKHAAIDTRYVDRFLAKHHLMVPHITHFVFHSGGAKVIDAHDEALDLTNGHINPSRAALRDYGNMSSPTVLFVLDYILQHSKPAPGDYGLVAALGPGFSAEQVLIRF